MKDEVLSDLYKLKPDVEAQISRATGYAILSNANINIIFASFGGGNLTDPPYPFVVGA